MAADDASVLLDPFSLKILAALQRDARQTVAQLSAAVGLSPTPCWKRVKEMEAAGVIRGYTARVDPEKVGLHLTVMVEVNLTHHGEEQVQRFEAAVAASPHIARCQATTGQADYLLTVLAPDIKHYDRFLHETIFKLPGVTHVRSSIVLREIKSEAALPIGPAATTAPVRSQARARRAPRRP